MPAGDGGVCSEEETLTALRHEFGYFEKGHYLSSLSSCLVISSMSDCKTVEV